MSVTSDVPALILAAGLGVRFAAEGGSGHKILAPLDDRPLVAHAVATAEAADVGSITVVIHPALHEAPEVLDLLVPRPSRPAIRVVVNERPEDGIGSTLAAGLAALGAADADASACVVLLADQPRVDPSVVDAVIAAWRSTGRPARARYLDGDSHPVVLPRTLWPMLTAPRHEHDLGARGLLDTLDVTTVDVATMAPVDVDGPADLALVQGVADDRRQERRP